MPVVKREKHCPEYSRKILERFSLLTPQPSSATIPFLCSLLQQNLSHLQKFYTYTIQFFSNFLSNSLQFLNPSLHPLETALVKVPSNLCIAESCGRFVFLGWLVLTEHFTLFPPDGKASLPVNLGSDQVAGCFFVNISSVSSHLLYLYMLLFTGHGPWTSSVVHGHLGCFHLLSIVNIVHLLCDLL